MVKHVILWKLKDELSENEKAMRAEKMKEMLEGLVGKVPGLISLQIVTNGLASSNADVMLESAFVSEEALAGYAVHKEHVAVADTYVRPYTQVRMCMDYEEKRG